jgi:hypothetical protein
MTFSSLISGTVPHHGKFSSRAGRPITRLIQHHWAGVGGGIERMSDPNQQASCTYIITTDGTILGHVPEEYRPWTSGSAEADAPSITIEVQNTGGQVNGNDSDPSSWPISDAAYGAIIRLLVDVAQRHGWAAIDADTYVGHRQFYSTACPGGYLWSRMDQTRQLAQQVFTGSLSYASEAIKALEDDMATVPQNEWEHALKVLNSLADNAATKGDLKKIWKEPIDRRNPSTGELEQGATTPETVLSYADWRLVVTLDSIAASARGIVDAVKAAPQADAAQVAEDAYKAFSEKLGNLKLTVTSGD